MKKTIFKTLASVMAAIMILASVQINAFAAATTLTFSENTGINTPYYSNIVYNGDDYIASVFQGVNADKTIAVTKGSKATLVFGAADFSSTTYGNEDISSYANGVYHYGTGNGYCIATDTLFSLSGDGVTAEVSGFGASRNANGTVGGYLDTKSVLTTFTIDASNLKAGEYKLSLTFKYQMKKKGTFGAWSTAKEYSGTVDGFVLKVSDVSANGGSIRVTNPGLRFGFQTKADPDTVEEYGFIYKYVGYLSDVTDISMGDAGVKQSVATNHLTNADGVTTFNLVFINIPESSYSTYVSAKGYVKIDGNYYFTKQLNYSFKRIARNVVDDSSIDDDTKQAVQRMIDSAYGDSKQIDEFYFVTSGISSVYGGDVEDTYSLFEGTKHQEPASVSADTPTSTLCIRYKDGTEEEYAYLYLINKKVYVKFVNSDNDNFYLLNN